MSMYPFWIMPIPGINLPLKIDRAGNFALGKDRGTQGEIYTILTRALAGDETGLIGCAQQALNLGNVMMDRGWLGTLEPYGKPALDGKESSVLTSTMWSMCWSQTATTFEMWHDNHHLTWSLYTRQHRVHVELDGWDVEFTAVAIRELFERIYE